MLASARSAWVLLSSAFLFAVILPAQTPSFELGSDAYTIFHAENVVQGDFNNDGKPDLVYDGSPANSQTVFSLRLGNGDGTFQPPVAFGTPPMSTEDMVAADLDQDGNLD